MAWDRCANDGRMGDPEMDRDEPYHGEKRYCSFCLEEARKKGKEEGIKEATENFRKALKSATEIAGRE